MNIFGAEKFNFQLQWPTQLKNESMNTSRFQVGLYAQAYCISPNPFVARLRSHQIKCVL